MLYTKGFVLNRAIPPRVCRVIILIIPTYLDFQFPARPKKEVVLWPCCNLVIFGMSSVWRILQLVSRLYSHSKSVFDALLIGSSLVAAVTLCVKRDDF